MQNKLIEFPQLEISSYESISLFLKKIKDSYGIKQIKKIVTDIKNMKILLIGDVIIDQYDYVLPKGRAIKDPILSCDYLNTEIFAGGILAIANHLSDFVSEINLLTLIGDKDNFLPFIKENLRDNIKLEVFKKENAYTTLKRRFINKQRNEKLFKVEKMTDLPISEELSNMICDKIETIIEEYDMVIVGDFGHGFLNEAIINTLENKAKFLSVNVQTNSANLGFNYVTKYSKADFVSMDYRELQYAVQDQYSDSEKLLNKLRKKSNFANILVTMGKKGLLFSDGKSVIFSPAFKTIVKDTIGAGDTVFSLASILTYNNLSGDLVSFFSSCAGAIAVQSMGNKTILSKSNLNEFIENILKGANK